MRQGQGHEFGAAAASKHAPGDVLAKHAVFERAEHAGGNAFFDGTVFEPPTNHRSGDLSAPLTIG